MVILIHSRHSNEEHDDWRRKSFGFQGGLLTVVSAEMLTSAYKGFQRNTERKKHPDMKLNVVCLSASLLKPNGSKVQNAESKIHYQLLCSQKQQKEKDRPREVTGPSHTDLV